MTRAVLVLSLLLAGAGDSRAAPSAAASDADGSTSVQIPVGFSAFLGGAIRGSGPDDEGYALLIGADYKFRNSRWKLGAAAEGGFGGLRLMARGQLELFDKWSLDGAVGSRVTGCYECLSLYQDPRAFARFGGGYNDFVVGAEVEVIAYDAFQPIRVRSTVVNLMVGVTWTLDFLQI